MPPAPTPTVAILGAGWLGLPLGRTLLDQGYLVYGSTTRPERLDALREAGLKPFCLTVTDRVNGEGQNEFFSAETLILNLPPGRSNTDVEDHHPRQIEAVLEAFEAHRMRRLLFVSSTGVYGAYQGRVTEETPPEPTRPAGRALLRAETLLRERLGDTLTILRPGGLVGGNRRPAAWLAGRKDLPRGEAPVNLVHREDVIGVLLAILDRAAWGHTFNLCAEAHPRRRDYYAAQAKKAGLPPPVFAPGEARHDHKVVESAKVLKSLGYRMQHPDPAAF